MAERGTEQASRNKRTSDAVAKKRLSDIARKKKIADEANAGVQDAIDKREELRKKHRVDNRTYHARKRKKRGPGIGEEDADD